MLDDAEKMEDMAAVPGNLGIPVDENRHSVGSE
jgi:hypothetical protein